MLGAKFAYGTALRSAEEKGKRRIFSLALAFFPSHFAVNVVGKYCGSHRLTQKDKNVEAWIPEDEIEESKVENFQQEYKKLRWMTTERAVLLLTHTESAPLDIVDVEARAKSERD